MATRKGSENRFPLVRFLNSDDTPATPPSGESHLVGGVDKVPRWIDDTGAVTVLGSGTVAELDDVGDVNAPTPSNGDVLTWDSTPGEWVAAAAPGSGITNGLWVMAKSATLGDQTLTQNAATAITFDTAQIDSGSSVIDHANERLTAAATGLYIAIAYWPWGATVPIPNANLEILLNGGAAGPLGRLQPATAAAFGSITAIVPLSLTAGDHLTMQVNPGNVASVVARGSNTVTTRTSLSLIRLT